MLLNANTVFLLNGSSHRAQQILSYMSLVAGAASVVLASVFLGHNNTKSRNTALEAVSLPRHKSLHIIEFCMQARFLHASMRGKHGLEILAFAYSLPHAFFMWG